MTRIPNVGRKTASFITKMTKADAKAPIIALESAVITGRTLQAYKRGKGDEARERFIEETTGSVFWLFGVEAFNMLGDVLLGKILKKPGVNFDVGTDKVLRTPFDNFLKKLSQKKFSGTQIALMKGAKVLSSIVLANMIIGFVVPKINHYITNSLRSNDAEAKAEAAAEKESKNKNLSFKGAMGALNAFTNAIENTNTGKLLSTDFGIAGGRMYNARTNEERREIAIRDLGSIYFYMWASGHVGNLINLATTGNIRRLNPSSAILLDKRLQDIVKENGGEMKVEDFRKTIFGNNKDIVLHKDLEFETQKLSLLKRLTKATPLEVAKISDVEELYKDHELLNRIKEMAKLQPNKAGEPVITKQQLIDALSNAEITNPTLLDTIYNEHTNGAHNSEFKFIANGKLEKLKKDMINYAEAVCKEAKDGKITEDLLKNVKNKNVILNGVNFVAGFALSALFLSTLIPKIQYYITKKKTGVDAFPGTYDYEHHKSL